MADMRHKADESQTSQTSPVAILPEPARQLNHEEIAALQEFFRILDEWDRSDFAAKSVDSKARQKQLGTAIR